MNIVLAILIFIVTSVGIAVFNNDPERLGTIIAHALMLLPLTIIFGYPVFFFIKADQFVWAIMWSVFLSYGYSFRQDYFGKWM